MHHKVLINGRILQNKVYDSVVVRSNSVTKNKKKKGGWKGYEEITQAAPLPRGMIRYI